MKVSKKVSSTAFKCRGLFWGVFAAGILIFPGEFEIVRFTIGLALVLGGQMLRFWLRATSRNTAPKSSARPCSSRGDPTNGCATRSMPVTR